MQPNNSLTSGGRQGFSTIINAPNTRAMIDRSIGDPTAAAAFVSTLISVVNTTPKLKECDAGSIISAGLRGEIAMSLSLALGEYSIVPYGRTAQFQIGANGLKRLCIRSKQYSKIGFYDVREGEMVGRDPMTREPLFQWKEDEERESLPIIGYYGFYKLNEQNNDFFQCIYWSREKVLRHADRYSKAFSYDTYQKMLNGELSAEETNKLQNGSPWYGLPNSEAHTKMCLKTIAKQLLNDGLAPKEVRMAIQTDNFEERTGEPVIYEGDSPVIPAEEPTAETAPVDMATGEVIDVEPVAVEEVAVSKSETTAEPQADNKPKRGRPRKEVIDEILEEAVEQDTLDEFFS